MNKLTVSADELRAFAKRKISENKNVDDDWYSFNEDKDIIDVNMYNDDSGLILVTAYPVVENTNLNYLDCRTTDTSTVLCHITIPTE